MYENGDFRIPENGLFEYVLIPKDRVSKLSLVAISMVLAFARDAGLKMDTPTQRQAALSAFIRKEKQELHELNLLMQSIKELY